jgi:hypothetical protein
MINIPMKKLTAAVSVGFLYLANTVSAFAQNVDINVDQNTLKGVSPSRSAGQVITNALTIIFVIAALAVLFYLIIGAFQWITSGGDKEKVGKARGAITNALIGFAILALAAVIVKVVGQLVNINIFDLRCIPSLNAAPGFNANVAC